MAWWEDGLKPDVIHYFGPCPAWYLRFAREQEIKTVVTQLHTSLGSRPGWLQSLQGATIGTVKGLLPPVARRLGWDAYDLPDAFVAVTEYEAGLIRNVFRSKATRFFVVPAGADEIFFRPDSDAREDWFITTAVVAAHKRIAELAAAARLAGIKLKVLGRPYSERDPYFSRFLREVQMSGGDVEWCGEVSNRVELACYYHRACGFILPSTRESMSLSAVEAAASGCRLFLTDLPWARSAFGDSAEYLPNSGNPMILAEGIKQLLKAKQPEVRPEVWSWDQVAEHLQEVYRSVCAE
jgi:glycosyltransferase involved in cell wall biosynthesis